VAAISATAPAEPLPFITIIIIIIIINYQPHYDCKRKSQ